MRSGGSWLSIGQSKLYWNFSLFCEIWRKTVYSNEIMVSGPLIWLPCTFMRLKNWKLLKLFQMKWMTSVFDLGPLFDCPVDMWGSTTENCQSCLKYNEWRLYLISSPCFDATWRKMMYDIKKWLLDHRWARLFIYNVLMQKKA